MIGKSCLYWCAFLCNTILIAQTLKGTIVDAATGEPLESVAIYFDNTTIGTTTNDDGFFSIDYTDATQSTLVISYLGYEKVFITDYRSKTELSIKLVETPNELEEVLINYDDGLTRKQKLRLFRKEFLGVSEFAQSCKILNEEDLFLKYDSKTKTLSASSKKPILVINDKLQYDISYDLIDFEIRFSNVNAQENRFLVNGVVYFGTSYYNDIDDKEKRSVSKRRRKAYLGSVQHFMRSLYQNSLEEEGFILGERGFKTGPDKVLNIESLENGFKKVELSKKVDVYYKKNEGSEWNVIPEFFYIDKFGNYSPIQGVLFGGEMGLQRIGDSLPSDYDLEK